MDITNTSMFGGKNGVNCPTRAMNLYATVIWHRNSNIQMEFIAQPGQWTYMSQSYVTEIQTFKKHIFKGKNASSLDKIGYFPSISYPKESIYAIKKILEKNFCTPALHLTICPPPVSILVVFRTFLDEFNEFFDDLYMKNDANFTRNTNLMVLLHRNE